MLTKPKLFRSLDWYILTEVIGPILGGTLFFTFVFLMFQALRLADFFIIHGVGLGALAKMAGLMVLTLLPMALPVAFLIGVLIAFGRLSADSELIAMKANGISIYRIAAPVVLLSLVFVGLSLALSLEWVPWGDRASRSQLIRVSNTKVVSSIREGSFNTGFFDLLIYADKVDPTTNRLQRVFIYDEREARTPMTVVAQEGEILPVQTGDEFSSAIVLKLYRGNIHRNDTAEKNYQKIDFDVYNLFLKIDAGADTVSLRPTMIPYRELMDRIQEANKRFGNVELTTELWRRFTAALLPIIFVFLGIGYGTLRTRAVRAGAALITLVVVTLYYGIEAGAIIAAQKSLLPPPFAMILPDLIMGAIAYRSFRFATW